MTRELADDPMGTGIMSGAVHRARAKGTLLFAVKESAVGTEGRAYGLDGDGLCGCCLLAKAAGGHEERGNQKNGE